MARCSWDDFIKCNQYEVRVSPFSPTIIIPEKEYKVPAGRPFDLRSWEGKGYIIEDISLPREYDFQKGIGFARILDHQGDETKYTLTALGTMLPDGTKKRLQYFINYEPPGETLSERLQRYGPGISILMDLPPPPISF